ncbi:MAG: hypothetical protein ACOY4R_02470 [Pseudomonadota bacterium]
MSPDRPKGDYFCELLDFVMPWPDGTAAVLVAHVDASKRPGGTFCVAIVACGADRAKKAVRRWVDLWGSTPCHMTDLHALRKDFRNWTSHQAGEHLIRSVKLINRFASYAVAVSCDVADVERLAPRRADADSAVIHGGLAHSYALCCHMAMFALADLVRKTRQGAPDIAYFFERGDEHQGESQRFISTAVASPAGPPLYACRSHVVMQASDARLFEMADIFAWEWAKHIERVAVGRTKKRGSLRALLGGEGSDDLSFVSPSRHLFHMRGAALKRFYARCESVGMFSDNPTPDQISTLEATARRASLAYVP